ncbi:MAG: 4-hydroxy-3-methylbut-2-enyl diphosphate reductase [Gemmatimonadaceae bacterium]
MAADNNLDTYFRKGFGLKAEVQVTLEADYSGHLVNVLRDREYELTAEGVTVRLAREFGFCYGVERAVEYAYQTRSKFPGRRIFLVGEIIHNPHVNDKLRSMGIEILLPSAAGGETRFDFSVLTPEDVVILPAFGVTVHDFERLRVIGCVMVDTTCGSVLNVWKRVESYARDGFTSLIHGKHYHEETRATASQVTRYQGAHYLVVRDMAEALEVCSYMEGLANREQGTGNRKQGTEEFLQKFASRASEGFQPDRDLRRIGVANQTTMLARDSLAIAQELGKAMARAFGDEYAAANFRSFDTICSATQDRQDAVKALLDEPLDAMVVIGGYNSSNTISLAALCAERVTTYHVEDATAIDPEAGTIRHKPIGTHDDVETAEWLPSSPPVRVGITAGASTPNNKIGEAVARVFATAQLHRA